MFEANPWAAASCYRSNISCREQHLHSILSSPKMKHFETASLCCAAVCNDGNFQKRPGLQNKQGRKTGQSQVISSNEPGECLPCIYLAVQQMLQRRRL